MKTTRRLNFTNRQKLERSEVKINLYESKDAPPKIAVSFDFKTRLDPNARIFVEAHCDDTTQRFDFGRVSAPVEPENLILDGINLGGSILFRVKVVDDNTNRSRILASAENIRPEESEDNSRRGALMHIRSRDLGERTWTLELSDTELPVLIINKRIPEAISRLTSDPIFNGLIIPQVMRSVLISLAWPEVDADDDDGWKAQWKSFIQAFAVDDIPEGQDQTTVLGWVEDTVREFCERFRFCDAILDHLGEVE